MESNERPTAPSSSSVVTPLRAPRFPASMADAASASRRRPPPIRSPARPASTSAAVAAPIDTRNRMRNRSSRVASSWLRGAEISIAMTGEPVGAGHGPGDVEAVADRPGQVAVGVHRRLPQLAERGRVEHPGPALGGQRPVPVDQREAHARCLPRDRRIADREVGVVEVRGAHDHPADRAPTSRGAAATTMGRPSTRTTSRRAPAIGQRVGDHRLAGELEHERGVVRPG